MPEKNVESGPFLSTCPYCGGRTAVRMGITWAQDVDKSGQLVELGYDPISDQQDEPQALYCKKCDRTLKTY